MERNGAGKTLLARGARSSCLASRSQRRGPVSGRPIGTSITAAMSAGSSKSGPREPRTFSLVAPDSKIAAIQPSRQPSSPTIIVRSEGRTLRERDVDLADVDDRDERGEFG